MRQIPLASLAAILMMVGYKLAHPNNFKEMYLLGHKQFVPFIITVISILFTDLLIGILIGLGFSILYILYYHYKNPYSVRVKKEEEKPHQYYIRLSENVSFLHKARIRETLAKIPPHSHVIIDAKKTHHIDNDVIEVLMDFRVNSQLKHIDVEMLGMQKIIVGQAIQQWKEEQERKNKK
jgi:MFS superfamily sulfate permease-like transporter